VKVIKNGWGSGCSRIAFLEDRLATKYKSTVTVDL